jgi:hypothetical protein
VKIIMDERGRGFMGINKIVSCGQGDIELLSWQRDS